jgi:hypothetical protein
LLFLASALLFWVVPVTAADPVDFDRVIAPILSKHCLECHNVSDRKGKLDLSSAATVLRKQKPLIVVGKPTESILWEKVADDEMPPKKPLSAAEKAALKNWIEQGAKWGNVDPLDRFAFSSDSHAGADWWSLQPVKRPQVPLLKQQQWIKSPIDAFVLAKLEAKGLSPSPVAERRTLIRRVYFDLIGLPPAPEEIEQFINDPTADAYEKLLDRLLASPHYGERWARHWLDVARYTESQGFEYDRIRPNAWHYRDYVIQSFNTDKPYNLFVQEQIAGDVKNFNTPGGEITADGIVATSLLVCGPWDQAGNSQANLTQKKITREEEMEDLVSVIGQSFLGMTVNCARCHSHKYDPISHEDYYRFKAIFEGVRHGESVITPKKEQAERKKRQITLQQQLTDREKQIAALEQQARQAAVTKLTSPSTPLTPVPLARWTFEGEPYDKLGTMHGELVGGASIRNGRVILKGNGQYLRTKPLTQDVREKTLEAWLYLPTLKQGAGSAITLEAANGSAFDAVVFAERQANKWVAGSNSFVRTKDLTAPLEESKPAEVIHLAIVYASDNTITLYRNGKQYGEAYKQGELQTYLAGDARVLLGLRHTGVGNGSLQAEIQAAALYSRSLSSKDIEQSFAAGPLGGPVLTQDQLLAELSETERQRYLTLKSQAIQLRTDLQAVPLAEYSYTGTRKQPEPTYRLLRGNVTTPAEVVVPRALSIIKLPDSQFSLSPDAPESERRIKLAEWLVDLRHPLTARVMVNRLWHYHLGRGLVETPNDFGFNGARPTHPELLDWLASEFVEGKPAWSIKRMHKLIMLSSTYQQASYFNEQVAAIDSENTLFWRFKPRRLEGEIIRDAMLAVSGELNRKTGGPSFKPFTIQSFNSDFYEPKDMVGPEYNRRSIYRMHVNSGKSAMMDSLDCPDPSIKTPSRRVTTTPLAALALMNNSFVQRQAKSLDERVSKQTNGDDRKSIELAYELAFGRPATAKEMEQSAQLVKDHGFQALCWALLNASEFMYVK